MGNLRLSVPVTSSQSEVLYNPPSCYLETCALRPRRSVFYHSTRNHALGESGRARCIINVSVDPEIAFHRFFQELEPPPILIRPEDPDNRRYKGKKDLNTLPTDVRILLSAFQQSFNEALSNEKKDVPEHVDHPPFHFDYIDSDIPNAIAFQYQDYSFIGITVALVGQLWMTCERLSRNLAVAAILRVRLPSDEYQRLHAILFRIQLSFIISHEYTHHVHGHVAGREWESPFSSEIIDAGLRGNLDQQIWETDADGYAAYHVLANLIGGADRSHAIGVLKLEREDEAIQDEILLSCFVAAIGAYLFVRPPVSLDETSVYRFTHPPQAARMNSLMNQAINWCKQNRQPLSAWMTPERFEILMRSVAEATWGMNGGTDWSAQVEFFESNAGSEYVRTLEQSLKAYIEGL